MSEDTLPDVDFSKPVSDLDEARRILRLIDRVYDLRKALAERPLCDLPENIQIQDRALEAFGLVMHAHLVSTWKGDAPPTGNEQPLLYSQGNRLLHMFDPFQGWPPRSMAAFFDNLPEVCRSGDLAHKLGQLIHRRLSPDKDMNTEQAKTPFPFLDLEQTMGVLVNDEHMARNQALGLDDSTPARAMRKSGRF